MSDRAPPRQALPPVLKMPPDLLIPTLVALSHVAGRSVDDKRRALSALRPRIPPRTLINAYVLPSLKELGLFSGTLKDGGLSRFAKEIARQQEGGREDGAHQLVARQLLAMDSTRVGLVELLLLEASSAPFLRQHLAERFVEKLKLASRSGDVDKTVAMDRLGKWVNYLLYFGVLRTNVEAGASTNTIGVESRQIEALHLDQTTQPTPEVIRTALLEAYAGGSRAYGTRLYIPVGYLRDELGRRLRAHNFVLTDTEIDRILRSAPTLLEEFVITFSPFSGPATGGLSVAGMYAGYVSIRPRRSDNFAVHADTPTNADPLRTGKSHG